MSVEEDLLRSIEDTCAEYWSQEPTLAMLNEQFDSKQWHLPAERGWPLIQLMGLCGLSGITFCTNSVVQAPEVPEWKTSQTSCCRKCCCLLWLYSISHLRGSSTEARPVLIWTKKSMFLALECEHARHASPQFHGTADWSGGATDSFSRYDIHSHRYKI